MEAPRGALAHWIVIKDKKIDNYQAVVPSTWNAGPRDRRRPARPLRGRADGPPHAARSRSSRWRSSARSTASIPASPAPFMSSIRTAKNSLQIKCLEGVMAMTLQTKSMSTRPPPTPSWHDRRASGQLSGSLRALRPVRRRLPFLRGVRRSQAHAGLQAVPDGQGPPPAEMAAGLVRLPEGHRSRPAGVGRAAVRHLHHVRALHHGLPDGHRHRLDRRQRAPGLRRGRPRPGGPVGGGRKLARPRQPARRDAGQVCATASNGWRTTTRCRSRSTRKRPTSC